jgi:hypothetical protein
MVSEKAQAAIERILHDRLDRIGFEKADIRETADHDGDPILQIVIHYRRIGDSVDPTPTFSLARYLREALRPLGEERFPHFTHLFPEDQELKVA